MKKTNIFAVIILFLFMEVNYCFASNTFYGNYAGYYNKGSANTFLGYAAGIGNGTGSYNTFLGYYPGTRNTTGSHNVFLGFLSGVGNSTGGYNIFLGNFTGSCNTTGSSNVFLGYAAGYRNTTGFTNIFLGNYAGFSNTIGKTNIFLGRTAGYMNSTGSWNIYLGDGAGSSNVAGEKNVFLGYQAGYYETGSNKLYIANSYDRTLIYGDFSAGRVGINTTNPQYTLDVNGVIRGSNVAPSDIRLKENIEQLSGGLETVLGLRGVTFQWADNYRKGHNTAEGRQIGLVAQEVEKLLPELVYTSSEGDKSLDYEKLTAVLVEAIKEQQKEITRLREALVVIEDLKREVDVLKENNSK